MTADRIIGNILRCHSSSLRHLRHLLTFVAPMIPSDPTRRGDFVILLALCPAIAVSDTAVNAMGLGLAVVIVGVVSNLIYFAMARWLQEEVRLPVMMLVMGATVAAAELLMEAWLHEVGASLQVFLPLLAANFIILLRAQTAAPLASSIVASLKLAGGIALVLLALGVVRELVGRGSLLYGATHLFGDAAQGLEMRVFSLDMGFLLAMLPPGAFISLGVLIATRNWFVQRTLRAGIPPAATGS
jgi:electron transport complex protein RnfE